MGRKKLIRFANNALADNVLEIGKPLYETIKGKWNETYFLNKNPIVLELACGKGEYSVGLAQVYPEKNFIGIDVKGDRLGVGSEEANGLGLDQRGFLAGERYLSSEFFC